MTGLLVWLTISIPALTALGAENLARNPSFEQDADRDGVPDEWSCAGDRRLVDQTLGIDTGRDGRRCARLTCRSFAAGSAGAHAMLCQRGIAVKRGTCYRVTFWTRGKNIRAGIVMLGLSDTSVWADCGLDDAFLPTPAWKRHAFLFRANRDCAENTRLQIWFKSTGTLWVDEVRFEEAGEDLYRPGHIIRPPGHCEGHPSAPPLAGKKAKRPLRRESTVTNLVPNASFECGTDGWGSAEWDRAAHWGGSVNRLFGRLDTDHARHGQKSLRVDLTPENQPVSFFDYYQLHRTPIKAPLVGNLGWMEVQPGRPYTFSAFMKAARDGTPALLAIRQFDGRPFEKRVRVSRGWQRRWLSFTPTARWCYVLAGPDLRKTAEGASPPDRASLWLDAFQLEPARAPSAFEPRAPVEIGLTTDKPGNVFDWGEPLRIRLAVSRAAAQQHRRVKVQLQITDFFGKQIWRESLETDGTSLRTVPPTPQLRGFLRLHARANSGGAVCERTIRMAVIPGHQGGDSRFGVNHAYPWPHLLDLCRKAGLIWVRDWSLKWQQVEPNKGRFTFTEADRQINRPRSHGLRVLGLLPFPSSNWSSSAPARIEATDRYPQSRARAAYAPRDLKEFENYVGRTVAHYRGRIRWWQVFNEPLFTSYALPRKRGYDGATYARYTKAFARAARRANPQSRILAGIGHLSEGRIFEDFEQFFAAGGLAVIDAVDIHHYPRLRPPEFVEGLLQKLNALMANHGGRKPIWLTEYGYYADDDPSAVPMPHHGFNRPLASEQLQSEYAVRWAVLMFAGGVEKVFYHAGTCDGLNRDSLQGVFFEYGGRPHKIYAAQAVMAHLLTPTCRFVKRLALGPAVKACLFRDGPRLVGVVWAVPGEKPKEIHLDAPQLKLWDIMGRPQDSRRFAPSGTPVYVLADGLSDEQFEAAIK